MKLNKIRVFFFKKATKELYCLIAVGLFFSRRLFCIPRDIWQYLEMILVVNNWWGSSNVWHWDASKHTVINRTALHNKELPYSAPNVSSAQVKKPTVGQCKQPKGSFRDKENSMIIFIKTILLKIQNAL